MNRPFRQKILLYQITTVFGIMFAMIGFSYNVWRMEISEENNNIRMACFEILTELADLEQIIYTAHYDQNVIEGSPRKAWVKVGLIRDLTYLTAPAVEKKANDLYEAWSRNWSAIGDDETAVTLVVESIDEVRTEIKAVLKTLP